jgi:hypothetical protein
MHFLDMPILTVIVSLGAQRPDTWTQFVIGRSWRQRPHRR